jgi:hypothetical protein
MERIWVQMLLPWIRQRLACYSALRFHCPDYENNNSFDGSRLQSHIIVTVVNAGLATVLPVRTP